MATTTYEIAPSPLADVLLLVPRPTTAFAPWSSSYGRTDSVFSPTSLAIKASSAHLSLASKSFATQLAHLSSDNPDGRVHLTLEGVDPTAVRIVLDAVHGRGKRVPRSLDVETLAKVAVFVEKWQLGEAVGVYAERWFEKVEVPTQCGRDLLLYASFVFRQARVFEEVTRRVILTGTGALKTLGLPIRDGVSRESKFFCV
jgi:hypothetical protein